MDEQADSDQVREVELETSPVGGLVSEDMTDPTNGYAQQDRRVLYL